MEVIAPQDRNMEGHQVQIQVDGPQGKTIGPEKFSRFGIAGRIQATFQWAWDTSGLDPGDYKLTYSILPDGPTWTDTVLLHPADQVPPPEPQAHWETVETECCVLHYITGTDAARDIDQLEEMANQQAQDASRRLGVDFKEPIPITFLPRVLGHGGFTSQEIAVSYLDRNYAGSNPALVLHHEMIHLLDARLGGDFRPTMLVEGLAVYLSGGHFKPEPLLPRAAALLPPAQGCQPVTPDPAASSSPPCRLGSYLPLAPLADNFYFSQHEIGYIEASALIEFMVDTWGWEAFNAFYRDIHPPANDGGQAQAIDDALQRHFQITMDELETRFLQRLREEKVTPETIEDVRLTVDYYNTVRRYQKLLDPSAYFLTAWLPDPAKMREKGIVADYLRHPSTPENQALETLFLAADHSLLSKDYPRTQRLLNAINAMLDVFDPQGPELSQNECDTSLAIALIPSPFAPIRWPVPVKLEEIGLALPGSCR